MRGVRLQSSLLLVFWVPFYTSFSPIKDKEWEFKVTNPKTGTTIFKDVDVEPHFS